MEIRQIINQFVSKVSQAAESVVEFTAALKQKVSSVAIAVIASLQERYNNSYASSLLGRVTVNKDPKDVPETEVEDALEIENERLRKNEELRVAMIESGILDFATVEFPGVGGAYSTAGNGNKSEMLSNLKRYADLAGIQYSEINRKEKFSILKGLVSEHMAMYPTNKFDQ